MTNKTSTLNKARLHEHAGRIALNFEGFPTVYLSPELALKMAQELNIAGVQVRNGYHYSTREIEG